MKVLTKKEFAPAPAANKLGKIAETVGGYVVGKLEGCSAGCKGGTS
jgi:hypothetical protein